MAESKDVVEIREDGVSATHVFKHSVDGKDAESSYVVYDLSDEGAELCVTEEPTRHETIHLRNQQARTNARNATAGSMRAKGGTKDYVAEISWAMKNELAQFTAAATGGPITTKAYLKGVRLQMNVAD